MSAKRPGRLSRATTIVPLALLSAAVTASVAGVGGASTSLVASSDAPTPSVPAESIEAPATVSSADEAAPVFDGGGLGAGDVDRIVARSSTNTIPAAALAAYQRAESVINTADASCRLPWQLVAAIGRVESDHGRSGGSVLDGEGVATPAIYGPVLDGRHHTSVIADTDNGGLDANATYDRAVGPMQFLPATWTAVAVDADGDDVRDPQDIDDAALGAAIYLCSGAGDLSTTAGQKAAIYRYNHSDAYVGLVQALMNAYLQGDYAAAPNSTLAAGYLTVAPPGTPGSGHDRHHDKALQVAAGTDEQTDTTGDASNTSDTDTGLATDTPDGDNSHSTGNAGNNGDDTGDGGDKGDKGPLSGLPVPTLPHVTLPALPTTNIKPVDQVLTLAQALLQCTLDGLVDNPFKGGDRFDVCVATYTGK